MKESFKESIEIPKGVICELREEKIICTKDGLSLSRSLPKQRVDLEIQDNKIILTAQKANKKEWKIIKSTLAHLRNLFLGLEKRHEYSLEVCNVHFPMTLKIEKGKLIINNFLGEKVPRVATILPDVSVEINNSKIIVSSISKESAGQTSANIEKATKIRSRDRRIFQDGIFITKKPGVR